MNELIGPVTSDVEGYAKATILIVEDDLNLLAGMRSILEMEQYEVLTAVDGQDALDLLRTRHHPPDIIVSDIMMPRVNGIQLLEAVRRDSRWLTLPFIFLTARGDRTDIQHAKRLGVDDYVVKPYDPTDLIIAVESKLARYRILNQVQDNAMSALRRDILTILNHEFRTPLTFVVAYADLLNQTDASALTDTELVDFLRGVGVGAGRLRRLVENFILLVDLEAGEAAETFHLRRVVIPDPSRLICEALALVEARDDRQADPRPIIHVLPDTLPAITGDAGYLTQALAQLIDNAIKFSAAGTPVTIGATVEANCLSLWVRDQGRGIPAAELSCIQQSFYQINRSAYEDQGAGAGLAIVRGVMRLHGGRVSIESVEGEGSTFRLCIPLAQ